MFTSRDVRLTLQYLFADRGAPEHIRSDNGPEFIAIELQRWLERAAVRTLDIQKASPWENGDVESFHGKLRDELLNRELFLSVPEARYVLDEWRWEDNHRRPHGRLNWQTPAAYAAKLVEGQAETFSAASCVESPVGATPLPPTQHVNSTLPDSLTTTATEFGRASLGRETRASAGRTRHHLRPSAQRCLAPPTAMCERTDRLPSEDQTARLASRGRHFPDSRPTRLPPTEVLFRRRRRSWRMRRRRNRRETRRQHATVTRESAAL